MRRSGLLLVLAALLAPVGAGQVAGQTQASALPVQAAQVLRRLPHDREAYTEGLFIDRGQMFESTGQTGRSSVRRVDLATGKVLARFTIPAPLFGEGIAPWHKPGGQDQILGLTWRDGVGFRLSREGFRVLGQFSYLGEGWGLTVRPTPAGGEIVMSDGTDTLRFIDPATFRARRLLRVTAGGVSLPMLNELEWVDGEILANIWLTDRIARIDPASGHVLGWIDVSALHRETGAMGQDQVANGIAWDAAHRRLYVTGKEWPVMFEIRPPKG